MPPKTPPLPSENDALAQLLADPEGLSMEMPAVPLPGAGTAFDPQGSLVQLTQLVKFYAAQNLLHQRADGSFVIPGQRTALQEELERLGSLCECAMCAPYNQLHWRCVSCGATHEWRIQRPTQSWPLGVTGRGGLILHAVDSDACAREFLAKHQRGPAAGAVDAGLGVSVPTTDGGDPLHFFLTT